MPEQALAGRRALVSGGASGIGRATALALADAGASVATADVAPASLPQVRSFEVDVRSGADVDRLWADLAADDNLPDILVTSAGVGVYERLCEGDPEKWRAVLDTNVLGTLRLIRAFVPGMLERGGDVVLVSSVAAGKPHPWGGAYSASKAAVESIAETLRLETQPQVRVSTVAPGVVDTGFFDHLLAGEQSVESIGCGSLSAAQVARLIVYCISQPSELALNHITVRPRAQAY
jgi:NADP-dependent 3-hydroxy acid dehydrogenase YdfG